MGEERSVVFEGRTYTRAGDGSWIDEANIEAPTGLWSRLDRALSAGGLLARRPGDPHPRSLRKGDAVRYFVRRMGECRFHYRGLAETTPRGPYGFCCRCGRKPAGGRLHVVEDRRNPGEFFEYGADCWEAAMGPALAAALAAETDEGRRLLLGQNYRLLFEGYDAGSNTCRAPDEYWDPGRPPGPHRRGG